MELHTIIGSLAGIFGVVSFIPQVIQVWKTKSTHDISWGWLIIFSLSLMLWILYGTILQEIPIIFVNVGILTLLTIIVYVKLKYK